MMKRRNRYSVIEELYTVVWGEAAVEPRPVIVHIYSLRLKLKTAKCSLDVMCARGGGYQLKAAP